MNVISLALQGPPNLLRPPTTSAQPLQARAPIVESPIINTQCGAISLASLQPPLITAPPLQPRPATTGSLDLMLPLQPKLLPGYSLQSSYLSNTLSTVRPPDLDADLKPTVEVIVEIAESGSLKSCDVDSDYANSSKVLDRDSNIDNVDSSKEIDNDSVNLNNVFSEEINSNVTNNRETVSSDLNDDNPNNNLY